ncbi:MAG TPA: cytochrome c [Chthoniobacterales bacterium]|jgi:mono/diheme cytochrome c family protein|nr:cytochrome c [Chthoniobacterales bacterium]
MRSREASLGNSLRFLVSVIKRMVRMKRLGFGLLSIMIAGGCSKAPEETSPNPQAADVSSSPTGEAIFQTRCFVCHGRQGKGDGPASTGLGAAVRDLTAPSWQDATSDETIQSAVRYGAQTVGGSAAMAPNRDLSDTQIQSLVRYIRGLRK